jgi:myosin-5
LKSEQDEYILEAIMWTPISVPDNQDTIDLVDKKGTGILAVLDSACKMPKGDDKAFVQNLFTIHPKHTRLTQVTRVKKEGAKGIIPMNGFSISHYAGTVIYNAKDFLPKNADFTSPDTVALFAASKSPIGKLILAEPDETKSVLGGAAKKAAAPASGATAFKSTGSVFSTQLNSLMTTLYDTTPHFVRCIKPNKLKKPGIYLIVYHHCVCVFGSLMIWLGRNSFV